MTLVEAMAAVHASPHQAPAAWRVIQRAAESHARGPDREDVAQWAVIAVLRTVERGVRIDSPHAFLRIAAERRRIDMWRAWHQRHVEDERIDSRPDTRDEVREDDGRAANSVARMVAVIEAEIARDEAPAGRFSTRVQARMTALRRVQMRAMLLRALGGTYVEIRAALGLGDAPKNLVAQRIKCGRDPLLALIDRTPFPVSAAPAVRALREMVAKRWATAPRARPRRQTSPRPQAAPQGLLYQLAMAFGAAA